MENLKKIIKSIFQDLKSWKQIKINRWDLHTYIAFPVGILLGWLSSFLDFPDNFEQIGEYFIPMFGMFCGCFLFEFAQQGNRIIGEKERFESNKDAVVGTIVGVVAIIITKIVLTIYIN